MTFDVDIKKLMVSITKVNKYRGKVWLLLALNCGQEVVHNQTDIETPMITITSWAEVFN